tara:strand:+ start:4066 stop:5370 length:1305 start_codon:yes stop_codon:yes gene_type:complete
MKIGIVGVGYVGLVTGSCLSDLGHKVICVDKDISKISQLKKGIIPIFEPGIDDIIERNVLSGRLQFKTNLEDSLKDVEVVFIAVSTPSREGDGHADLSNIFNVIKKLAKFISDNQVIVIKSTVPVGTNKKIFKQLNENRKFPIRVVSNPEFLREGSAIEDFMSPDRIIVGIRDKSSEEVMLNVYKALDDKKYPIVFMDPESAELTKYAANGFLATKISFINEIAHLCEKVGANVEHIARGIGLDGRIGNRFLNAGPGFGGSCFPKDTLALTRSGTEFGAPIKIVETVIEVNNDVKLRMVDKILNLFDFKVERKVMCVLGVTFKPNTDDMREAPSLKIIPPLIDGGAIVRAIDPEGEVKARDILKKVVWYDDPYKAAIGADLILILTEWDEFGSLNLEKLSKVMESKYMADLRNVYSKEVAVIHGFEKYISVGRV